MPGLELLDLGTVTVHEASSFSVCRCPQPWDGSFAPCAHLPGLPEGVLPARVAVRLQRDRDPTGCTLFLAGCGRSGKG